jgi:hypothetical protein
MTSGSSGSRVTIGCNGEGTHLYNRLHYARQSSNPEVMTELVRLYAQIALLRKGPQDIPASTALLIATILAYVVVNLLISALLPRITGPWMEILAVDTAFTIVWYALLLRVLHKPERFVQTTTALFGYQIVLAPLTIASGWLLRRFGEDAAWQLPLGLLFIVMLVWTVAINSHVVKEALEWSTASSVALVILQIVTLQLLLYSIFPSAPK